MPSWDAAGSSTHSQSLARARATYARSHAGSTTGDPRSESSPRRTRVWSGCRRCRASSVIVRRQGSQLAPQRRRMRDHSRPALPAAPRTSMRVWWDSCATGTAMDTLSSLKALPGAPAALPVQRRAIRAPADGPYASFWLRPANAVSADPLWQPSNSVLFAMLRR